MAYFDDEKNVSEYIKMAEGYDGKELIAILETHLKAGSTVLELGMGPGKDLDRGNKTETYHGLRFVYYTEEELAKRISSFFDIVDLQTYTEMEEHDSIYVIASMA